MSGDEDKTRDIYVLANLDDLMILFVGALRYGLGRRTYVTHTIPKVIKSNMKLYNEKWLVNFLRSIQDYEQRRKHWQYGDDECDYQSWMALKAALREEYIKRGFERDLSYHRLEDEQE